MLLGKQSLSLQNTAWICLQEVSRCSAVWDLRVFLNSLSRPISLPHKLTRLWNKKRQICVYLTGKHGLYFLLFKAKGSERELSAVTWAEIWLGKYKDGKHSAPCQLCATANITPHLSIEAITHSLEKRRPEPIPCLLWALPPPPPLVDYVRSSRFSYFHLSLT